jgi:hypothetical protein
VEKERGEGKMSKKKMEFLKECVKVLEEGDGAKWYDENMKGKAQSETINDLEHGISSGKLTIREALSIALIVGVQWNEKFEGVP